MKIATLILKFFKGNRIASIVTLLLMAVSLCLTVYVGAKINYISYDANILDDTDNSRIFSLMSFPTKDENGSYVFLKSEDVEAEFENDPAVLDVYTLPRIDFTIKDFPANFTTSINVMLVSEELMNNLPDLVGSGIDISKIENPETDCILISPILNCYDVGDTVKLYETEKISSLKVVGKASSPYKFFSLQRTTNVSYSFSHIFIPRLEVPNIALMLETEENRAYFESELTYQPNCIIEFRPDATDDEVAEVLERLERKGAMLKSFDEILETTRAEIKTELRTTLPFPLFLLAVSFVAYVSMLILMFKKKEREFAVYSITGASRKRIAATYMTASSLLMLPSVILSAILCILFQSASRGRNPIVLPLYVNGTIYLIILGYALLNLAISALITCSGMKKYSPLEFLRGVTK